ncbi:MAG TPA: transglutaminase-like domain-containing protein [Verrucomicrobiota bacterium]|nr:transglutaminase-like domain-containing protein [Verrucomicrobiota bacterium]
MNPGGTSPAASEISQSQRKALLNLLADEDPAVYRTIREKLLSCGPPAAEWLRPLTTSNDPALRRRARQIVLHFDRQAADDHFLAFCLRHGEEFDLEQGAWLFAQTQYPLINVEAYQAVLDGYADDLRCRYDAGAEPRQILATINGYLFGQLGFIGNEENYYDPDNSYLNRVLDSRMGNPISLSLLYILLARRLRLPIAGIGLPGYFLCRFQSTAAEVFVDPFNRGKLLTKADCIKYLTNANCSRRDEYLTPVTARRFLLRICTNLHQVYQRLEAAVDAMRLQRYLVALAR